LNAKTLQTIQTNGPMKFGFKADGLVWNTFLHVLTLISVTTGHQPYQVTFLSSGINHLQNPTQLTQACSTAVLEIVRK